MKYVFFDLETSDKLFVAQILSYSFVVTDEYFNIIDKLTDKIKISPTQLPRVGAIMTNRINVLEHQETSVDNERVAMIKIRRFLDTHMTQDDITLTGYNSNAFDVPFLRTSMIRNGVNPYARSMKLFDVYHVVQYLSLTESTHFKLNEPNLKLENVLQSLGIITGKQSHDAEDDVLNLIKLCKHIQEKKFLDIHQFRAYQPKRGTKICRKIDFSREDRNVKVIDYYALLEENKTQALWINLREYENKKDKSSLSWFNKDKALKVFVLADDQEIVDESIPKLAQEAVNSLSHITLDNFFDSKNCDVEQFIYMMNFSENEMLQRAIDFNNLDMVRNSGSKHVSVLYLRFLCNQNPEHYGNIFCKYADYRYGGKMKINKNDNTIVWEEGVKYPEGLFHPTLDTMTKEIFEYKIQEQDDMPLIDALISFYNSSYVMKALKPLLSSQQVI